MATIYSHRGAGWYVAFYPMAGVRKRIFLGNVTKSQAQNVARRIDLLIGGNRIGEPPPQEVAIWLAGRTVEFLDKLEAVGLLSEWSRPKACPKFLDYWDTHIDGRAGLSASTRKGFNTARKHAEAAFGNKTLDEISVGDAKKFQRELIATYAPTHGKKILERSKQVFAAAIDDRLFAGPNPFDGLTITGGPDKSRAATVSRENAFLILEKLASQEAKTLFALSRFCGLRVPHEALALTWDCVDWEQSRLRIPCNTKTGFRVLPLFQPALREIEKLWEQAPKTEWVFNRARASAGTTWRNWLLTAIRAANLTPHPKLWHNLRSTARTEAQEIFPDHVCNAWFGHSSKVARDHYLQVMPEHWDKATRTESLELQDECRARVEM